MIRRLTIGSLAALVALAAQAGAMTGREVIDTAQQRNGFSTWHDRTAAATLSLIHI